MGKLYKKCSGCDKTIRRPVGYAGSLLCLNCRNKKLRPPKKCVNCDKIFVPHKIRNKFCSPSCASTYNRKGKKHSNQTIKRLSKIGQSTVTQNKRKKTLFHNSGFEFPNQDPKTQLKIRNTYIEKYKSGWISTGLKIKYFKNTELYYQGTYELKFLELCEKLNIIKDIKRGPSIKYNFENSPHVYISDFLYVPLNIVIEIKSTYFYNVHANKCEAKKIETVNQGYNYLFIIDNNFEEFIKKALP